MEENDNLQQARIQPAADIEALQKNYKELQAEFTKKSQALKDLEAKYNSVPKREDIIREYLISSAKSEAPAVMVSSATAFDLAKEKKPTDFNEAEALAIRYFRN
jgi:cell division protein FtsB